MKRARKRTSRRKTAKKRARSKAKPRRKATARRKAARRKTSARGKTARRKKSARRKATARGRAKPRRKASALRKPKPRRKAKAPRKAKALRKAKPRRKAMARAAAPAGEPTLLVPGTQATCLEDQDGNPIYNVVRVSLGLDRESLGEHKPDEWLPLLSMRHAPGRLEPVDTSLEPGIRLLAGRVVSTPYDRLKTLSTFYPYDWRGDLRLNAAQLLQYLRDHRPAGGGRWNLIGHSQGGLLIVLASKLVAHADEFSQLVARVVLVGAPLAGTMQATRALLTGRDDLGPGMQTVARDIGRTWPALYQMLPAWNAVLDPSGNPVPAAQQLTQSGGWPDQVGIQDDLLLRARETQALLADPFALIADETAILSILGKGQDTPVSVVRDANGLQPTSMRNERGDSLVPANRTVLWGGPTYESTVLPLGGNVSAHAMLCDDEEAVSAIQRFLAAPVPV